MKFNTITASLATVGIVCVLLLAGPGYSQAANRADEDRSIRLNLVNTPKADTDKLRLRMRWNAITDGAHLKKLQASDRVAFVCNDCRTIAEIALQSPAQTLSLAKDGTIVSFPACSHKTMVLVKSEGDDPSPGRQVTTYVNEKGEECGFLAMPSS